MSNIPSARQRKLVRERAGGYCEYCLSSVNFAVQSFECEHIIPVAQGGKTVESNLAFACGGCNRCKSAKTMGADPDSGEIVPLFNPRTQLWYDHFAWNEDFTLVIGLTATGRATVQTLRLNRPGVVNLRRILAAANEHPPKITIT